MAVKNIEHTTCQNFIWIYRVVNKHKILEMEGGSNIQERESQSSQEIIEDQNDNKSCSYFCCHPLGTGHRFVALFFMCFLGFGKYKCDL